jgi:hypothetical protein
MTKNIIDVKINTLISRENRTLRFSFLLIINGKPINDNRILDLYGILNLIIKKNKSNIYFWNCECGYPECIGMEPIHTDQKNENEITIYIPTPCCVSDYEDKSYQYWKINHQIKVVKINPYEIAKQLWDLTFKIESIIKRFSKKLELLQWPAHPSYGEYIWPENLPVNIRNQLLEEGYSF